MRRRDLMKGGLAIAAQAVLPMASAGAAPQTKIPYGSAVRGDALVDDPDYRAALIEHCNLVVPEGGLKWDTVRPSEDRFEFYEGDKLLAFADQNDMKMRGHTLIWYASMPDWTSSIRGKSATEKALGKHIDTVVGHYKGKLPSWDVINEAIAEKPTKSDYLRPSLWLDNMGKTYIDTAFRRAAAADPSAQLVINEYDIECVDARSKARREALLRVVRDLRDRDAPVHAVGFQGHLKGQLEIDKEGVSSFVAELKAMDVDVLVTELDVIDNLLPADETLRDEAIAGRVTDLLQAVFDVAPPTAILTWGISDKYTWVPMYFTRDDGSLNRPLPLDRNYKVKPLMQVIDRFAGRS
ncbi:endo-1,4-beta-xylanase [Neorhizobium sp. NCHU2750]|uniref:endo-1,4-beta-xylanase n=1 Tax=Neorhizobium sp. NCHU2750 TaxID=1825976 RepID=UPI000E7084AE|nr:endo-1,4-beta-xylanase [Neorhizobium sp. NCHU2750]